MKHTQGPWKVMYTTPPAGGESALSVVPAATKEGVIVTPICKVSPASTENDTDKANAVLIAHAPQLKVYLEALVKYLGKDWQGHGKNDSVVKDIRNYLIRLNKQL